MENLLTAWPSKLFIVAICSVLFWWGGDSWHNARRFIMPVVLTLTALFLTKLDFWCVVMLSCCGAFCLGYGVNSPLRHCFGNGWGRGIWGLIAATCLSLPLFLTHHLGIELQFLHVNAQSLSLILLLIYLTLNFILENALKNIPQLIGDPIIGASFGLIVFLIR